jgi:hypothetical protein
MACQMGQFCTTLCISQANAEHYYPLLATYARMLQTPAPPRMHRCAGRTAARTAMPARQPLPMWLCNPPGLASHILMVSLSCCAPSWAQRMQRALWGHLHGGRSTRPDRLTPPLYLPVGVTPQSVCVPRLWTPCVAATAQRTTTAAWRSVRRCHWHMVALAAAGDEGACVTAAVPVDAFSGRCSARGRAQLGLWLCKWDLHNYPRNMLHNAIVMSALLPWLPVQWGAGDGFHVAMEHERTQAGR